MPRQPAYLVDRNGAWYASLNIPADLQTILARTKYRQSLRTRDKEEALRRVEPLIKQWKKWISEARASLPTEPHGPPLTRKEILKFAPKKP